MAQAFCRIDAFESVRKHAQKAESSGREKD